MARPRASVEARLRRGARPALYFRSGGPPPSPVGRGISVEKASDRGPTRTNDGRHSVIEDVRAGRATSEPSRSTQVQARRLPQIRTPRGPNLRFGSDVADAWRRSTRG